MRRFLPPQLVSCSLNRYPYDSSFLAQMANRRKRKFALRLRLECEHKSWEETARIELDVVVMLEIAFSSARERQRIVFSPQNRRTRRGSGWKEISSLIYATFSLQIYREPAPIGSQKARNAAFVLMPANLTTLMFDWRKMGDRNNGGCFEVNDENECFPLPEEHTYVCTFKYLGRRVSFCSCLKSFFFIIVSIVFHSWAFGEL